MADFVVSARFDDQTSAGAQAAADALGRYADAADKAQASAGNLDGTVTRVAASGSALVNKYDSVTKATNGLQRAQDALASGTASLAQGVASGAITAEAAAGATATLENNVAKAAATLAAAKAAQEAMTAATVTGTAATTAAGVASAEAGAAAGLFQHGMAGASREAVVLGHELIQGNFNRIPGSIMVMAERMGGLVEIIKLLGAAMVTPVGLMVELTVGLAAGAAAWDYYSNRADHALQATRNQLALTKTDAASLANEVVAAASAARALPGFVGSKADTRTATTTIAGSTGFFGSQADLTADVGLADAWAQAMGEKLPEAATKLAQALADPEKAAQKLADEGYRYFDTAQVQAIKHMQDSGDILGAQAKFLDDLRKSAQGAADAYSHLGDATGKVRLPNRFGSRTVQRGDPPPTGFDGQPVLLGDPIASLGGARAVGMFQVLPSTAEDVMKHAYPGAGYNPAMLNDTQGNMQVGIAYLLQLLAQDGGNRDLVLAQYGGYGGKPDPITAASGYINRVNSGNIANLPAGVADQIAVVAQGMGITDPSVIAFAQRVALAESGGRQFTTSPANTAASRANDLADKTYSDTMEVANKKDPLAAAAGLQAEIKRFQDQQATLPVGSKDWETLGRLIDADKQKLIEFQDPAAKVSESLDKQTAILRLASPAAQAYAQELQQATDKAKAQGQGALTAAQQAEVLASTQSKLDAEFAKTTAGLDVQIAQQAQIAQAWQTGTGSVRDATDAIKAQTEAAKTAVPGTADYAREVGTLTDKYHALAVATADNQTRATIAAQRETMQMLDAELRDVGATTDARARDLAILKERETIIKAGGDIESAASQEAIANAAAIADATSQLQRQQNAINDLASMATQAFDQVGNAITNAFAGGAGASVNFGNVARSVMASVLQEVAKLAVLNPVMNSLFGGSRTTLTDVLGAVGSGGGLLGGSGGSGGGISFSSLGNLYSVGKSLFTGGGSFTTGIGSIDSLLGTTLWGGGAAEGTGAATSVMSGIGGGTTLGGLLGGAGAGMAAGSLLNTLVGGNQLGGTIGSGVGSLAGAAIGSIVPGIGTLIGGLIGGAAGGGLGGLFGPSGIQHHGWAVDVGANAQGQLVITNQTADKFDNSAVVQSIQSQLDNINQTLAALGVKATGSTVLGGNNGAAQPGDLYSSNGYSAMAGFTFGSSDSTLNSYLQGRSFSNPTDLMNFGNLIKNYLEPTTDSPGDLTTSVNALNASFSSAIATAQQYGIATDTVTAAWQKAYDTVFNGTYANVAALQTSWQDRIQAANGNALPGQLDAFDAQAAAERNSVSAQLVQAFGSAFTQTAYYAELMGQLNDALAAERDALKDAKTQQAAGQAAGTVGSLVQYVTGLRVGSASPLSPQAQLDAARSQFQAMAAQAAGGDATALAQVQGYASSYLSASRAYNGSGTGYAADFDAVLTALQAVAAQGTDALTASVLQQATQKQTDVLSGDLASLRTLLSQILTSLRQGNAAPARVAA